MRWKIENKPSISFLYIESVEKFQQIYLFGGNICQKVVVEDKNEST
jgi:hypothetical protein